MFVSGRDLKGKTKEIGLDPNTVTHKTRGRNEEEVADEDEVWDSVEAARSNVGWDPLGAGESSVSWDLLEAGGEDEG